MIADQFDLFFRPLPEPLCLVSANASILAANPAATKFLGENETELRKKTLFDIAADSQVKTQQILRNWTRSRELVPGPLKVRAANDKLIACNCSGSLIQPRTDDTPALVLVRIQNRELFTKSFSALNNKIALLQREIITREHAERALIQSKAQFEAMFNSIADAVTFVDTQRQILMINPAHREMFGYDDLELKGKTSEILYADKQDYYDQGRIRYHSETTAAGAYEVRYRRKNGEVFWSETLGTKVIDSNGVIIGFIGMIRDITDRKQTEKELEQYRNHLENMVNQRTADLEVANKEIESFSYSVSHDLRAPLRGIDGFSQALLEDYTGMLDDTGIHYLNRIRHNAQHMAHLIDDLLELSRVARAELKQEMTSLSTIALSVVEKLTESSPDRVVDVSIAGDLRATGDKNLLYIVLDNLLGNAWKYTSKTRHAQIEVGDRQLNNETIYYIQDNGAGFSMKYYNKLFRPFQRLHKPTDFEGTGIGLATVERIIRRHNGRIWADAKIGQGATFYFTLGSCE